MDSEWRAKFLPQSSSGAQLRASLASRGCRGFVRDGATELGISTGSSRVLFRRFPLHPNLRSPALGGCQVRRSVPALSLHPRAPSLKSPAALVESRRAYNLAGGTVSKSLHTEDREVRALLKPRATEVPSLRTGRGPGPPSSGHSHPGAETTLAAKGEARAARAGIPEGGTYLLPQPHLAGDARHHVHFDAEQRAAEQEGREHLAADQRRDRGRHLDAGALGRTSAAGVRLCLLQFVE